METKLVRSSDPAIVVHQWADSVARMNPPTYIPKAYVTKRAKGLKMQRGGGLKSIMFTDRDYLGGITVVGDLAAEDMRAVAVYTLEFEDMISRALGGKNDGYVYRVRIYADQGEFRKVAVRVGAANAMSYYDPHTKDIVMWFDKTMRHDELQGLLAHEFCHAYMDIVYRCVSPLWFAEGMAEYFQNFNWAGDHATPGAINEVQLRILEYHREVPIDEFVKLGRESFYGYNFKQLYAQAWTVVHFLMDADPMSIRNLLTRGLVDVRGLEGEWRDHLHAMRSMGSR